MMNNVDLALAAAWGLTAYLLGRRHGKAQEKDERDRVSGWADPGHSYDGHDLVVEMEAYGEPAMGSYRVVKSETGPDPCPVCVPPPPGIRMDGGPIPWPEDHEPKCGFNMPCTILVGGLIDPHRMATRIAHDDWVDKNEERAIEAHEQAVRDLRSETGFPCNRCGRIHYISNLEGLCPLCVARRAG